MVLRYTLLILFFSPVINAQIPDSIRMDGQRQVDSMINFHNAPNLLQYNCRASCINMVGTHWPDCPQSPEEYPPNFGDHHELNLYEDYRLVYDYVGHVKIEEFVTVVIDHYGQYIAANWFLSDDAIKQYGRINYTEQGAIAIAKKIGLSPGVGEWEVKLRCIDLASHSDATPLENREFIWQVINVTDPGDGCEVSGHYLMISANSGKLLHENEYHVECIE